MTQIIGRANIVLRGKYIHKYTQVYTQFTLEAVFLHFPGLIIMVLLTMVS